MCAGNVTFLPGHSVQTDVLFFAKLIQVVLIVDMMQVQTGLNLLSRQDIWLPLKIKILAEACDLLRPTSSSHLDIDGFVYDIYQTAAVTCRDCEEQQDRFNSSKCKARGFVLSHLHFSLTGQKVAQQWLH